MHLEDPEVWMLYQYNPFQECFDVVGVFSDASLAHDVCGALPEALHATVLRSTMTLALGEIREQAKADVSRGLARRIDSLSERVGQLTALVSAKQQAA